MRNTDFAIAGGGIIGLSAALALAQLGCSVTVIERTPFRDGGATRDSGRVFVLTQSTVSLLDRMGVWRTVGPLTYPLRDIVLSNHVPADRCAAHPLTFGDHKGQRTPLAFIIAERHLKQALVDHARQSGRIEILGGRTITAQQAGQQRILLDLSTGEQVAAALLIGCEGRGSATAARAGVKIHQRDSGQTAFVQTLRHDQENAFRAHQYLLPMGPLTILPVGPHRSSVTWTLPHAEAEALKTASDACFARALKGTMGANLGPFHLEGGRVSFPLTSAIAERFIGARLALLGDAAHVFHPMTGQGLNYGFRDIETLRSLVATARQAGGDVGAPALLARYQLRRRPDARMMRLVTDNVISFFAGDNVLLASVRHLGLRTVGAMPPIRSFLIRRANGLREPLQIPHENVRP
ncbi:MAG: FAD-dependent oxidoreductase [Rhodobacteraceae bacterium]|nr:FAD-dependent oxidoreductase [Paracoccaceae bacterium]MBR9822841.1 FAD-dependent oxidoreductase [Paracoccaceae bacterium]